jgi:hypothetical protein
MVLSFSFWSSLTPFPYFTHFPFPLPLPLISQFATVLIGHVTMSAYVAVTIHSTMIFQSKATLESNVKIAESVLPPSRQKWDSGSKRKYFAPYENDAEDDGQNQQTNNVGGTIRGRGYHDGFRRQDDGSGLRVHTRKVTKVRQSIFTPQTRRRTETTDPEPRPCESRIF